VAFDLRSVCCRSSFVVLSKNKAGTVQPCLNLSLSLSLCFTLSPLRFPVVCDGEEFDNL